MRVVPALRSLGIAVEGLLMSAKHGAKENAAWTKDLKFILMDGIESNRQGKQLAHERVRAAPSATWEGPLSQGF